MVPEELHGAFLRGALVIAGLCQSSVSNILHSSHSLQNENMAISSVAQIVFLVWTLWIGSILPGSLFSNVEFCS